VLTGPRVGLRQAGDRPWRFWIADDPTVSTYRPAVRRAAGS
jgi:DNA-3-methyladenine glycosylase